MKKLITMMLVLLIVGGAVFGADGGTLTLNSTVAGFTGHGFFGESAKLGTSADFEAVKGILTDVEDDPIVAQDFEVAELIDLETDIAVDVARYYFASNSPQTGYTIKFDVGPFKLFDGENLLFSVPLTIDVSKEVAHANVTVTEGLISTSGDLGTEIAASGPTLVATTAAGVNGPKYVGLILEAVSTGSANLAYGIPAGNYVATVVAYIDTL